MADRILEIKPHLLQFVISSDKNYVSLVDLLLQLKDVNMSLSILQQTDIGKVVTKLKRHVKESPDTSTLIDELLTCWKDIALQESLIQNQKGCQDTPNPTPISQPQDLTISNKTKRISSEFDVISVVNLIPNETMTKRPKSQCSSDQVLSEKFDQHTPIPITRQHKHHGTDPMHFLPVNNALEASMKTYPHVSQFAKKQDNSSRYSEKTGSLGQKIMETSHSFQLRSNQLDPPPASTKRRSLFNSLLPILNTVSSSILNEMPHSIHDLAVLIESALFKQFLSDADDYFDQFQSIRFNLAKNAKLLEQVCLMLISPEKLATMTSEELATDEVRKKREAIIEESNAARQPPKLDPNCSTEACPKCGSFKANVVQAQTRSADEPMTQFFTCTRCLKKWKR